MLEGVSRGGVVRFRRAAVVAVLVVGLLGAAAPDDPLVKRQYHLQTVRALDAWQVGRGAGQVIAVLDTGVALRHPDLRGRLVPGIDLVDRGTRPRDRNGHGTFVAGVAVAVADNAQGGAGVAPRAKVMPVRVLDDEGIGTSDIVARGIRWATRNGATVINLSLADVPGQERSATDLITTDVELAIRQAALEGVVVVAAAGNDGVGRTPYAADLPALVVGATDADDALWEHTNYDDSTLFAPGVDIVSTYVGDPYAIADGTSFATPIVAAGAALLLQQGASGQATRRLLTETARPVGAGYGRVDIAAALGIAPPDRTRPSPRSDPPADRPRREPRPEPVQPEPVRPDDPLDTAGLPPAAPPDTADAPPVEDDPPLEQPSPLAEPAAADPAETTGTDLAAGDADADADASRGQAPWWPYAVAGGLLFALVVLLGGQLAARRPSR
jgi:subtilisin family serine protease